MFSQSLINIPTYYVLAPVSSQPLHEDFSKSQKKKKKLMIYGLRSASVTSGHRHGNKRGHKLTRDEG